MTYVNMSSSNSPRCIIFLIILFYRLYGATIVCYHAFYLPLIYVTFLADFFQVINITVNCNILFSFISIPFFDCLFGNKPMICYGTVTTHNCWFYCCWCRRKICILRMYTTLRWKMLDFLMPIGSEAESTPELHDDPVARLCKYCNMY